VGNNLYFSNVGDVGEQWSVDDRVGLLEKSRVVYLGLARSPPEEKDAVPSTEVMGLATETGDVKLVTQGSLNSNTGADVGVAGTAPGLLVTKRRAWDELGERVLSRSGVDSDTDDC
jgi:hypothetical protein